MEEGEKSELYFPKSDYVLLVMNIELFYIVVMNLIYYLTLDLLADLINYMMQFLL